MAKATFAAGCFWGVEAAFRRLPGVMDTRVGYTGGSVPDATYEMVCGGGTGHAEAVEVRFDPERISYEALLDCFFSIHDPTTLNRQGPDIGSQYRSAIFFHDSAQEAAAKKRLQEEGERYTTPVVTVLERATAFYEAEAYHQCYLEKRRGF